MRSLTAAAFFVVGVILLVCISYRLGYHAATNECSSQLSEIVAAQEKFSQDLKLALEKVKRQAATQEDFRKLELAVKQAINGK